MASTAIARHAVGAGLVQSPLRYDPSRHRHLDVRGAHRAQLAFQMDVPFGSAIRTTLDPANNVLVDNDGNQVMVEHQIGPCEVHRIGRVVNL